MWDIMQIDKVSKIYMTYHVAVGGGSPPNQTS